MTHDERSHSETLPAARSRWMRAPATRKVLAALTEGGRPARFVGGCVRDTLMGRTISDIDIATPLLPDAVIAATKAAGLKAIPTGIDHGTVTVVADGQPFEVTTLRRDVATDGRRAVVAFTDDWREDAARRDFTINALSADPDGTVHDYFGGVEDARAGRVRFVGDPVRRIEEDVLRLLRFFRFYAQLGTPPPDPAALEACQAMAGRIGSLSGERVRVEILKLLAAPDPLPAWRLMIDHDVAAHTFEETGDFERLSGLVAVEPEADPIRRLAALQTLGREGAELLADRLKTSRDERDRLIALADRGAAIDPAMSEGDMRQVIYRLGGAVARDAVLLAWAGSPEDRRFEGLLRLAGSWEAPRFPLKGRDALALGMDAGPEVGDLLRSIEEDWIAGDFREDRAALLEVLKRRCAAS